MPVLCLCGKMWDEFKMKTNRGKDFERSVKAGLAVDGYYVIRLQDSMGGFSGVNNPCDFIAFRSPMLLMLECKAIHGNTLNFKTHIRPNQERGMYKAFMENNSVYGGFLVWYIDHDKIKFYPIHELVDAKANGELSFSVRDSQFGFDMPAKKLRVNLMPSFKGQDFAMAFVTANLYKNKAEAGYGKIKSN